MKKSFRALVIDDERLARKDLIALLGAHDQVTVVGEAEDVPSAINTIQALNPDVIFLDIQMPGDSGFDLLEKTEVKAHIIFVTAYDEYAIRAFEVNALDYLLKPVNPERLAKALEKLELQERDPRAEIRKLNYEAALHPHPPLRHRQHEFRREGGNLVQLLLQGLHQRGEGAPCHQSPLCHPVEG
jgi:DNA-binding LytR/AlgR family response regulator